MKIVVKNYQNTYIGNFNSYNFYVSPETLVSDLKKQIYERLRIDPSQQRLTVKMVDIEVITNY